MADRNGHSSIVSLIDGNPGAAATGFLAYFLQSYWERGTEPQRPGSGHESLCPYQVFETAGKLHPAMLYGGLLAAVRRRNSVVLAGHCRALGLARQGEGWRVTTGSGDITARHVVVATNAFGMGVGIAVAGVHPHHYG